MFKSRLSPNPIENVLKLLVIFIGIEYQLSLIESFSLVVQLLITHLCAIEKFQPYKYFQGDLLFEVYLSDVFENA